MNLLMLSGNSLRNREWIYEAQTELKDLFEATHIQAYRHWETGQEWIDLPHELSMLKASSPSSDYGVFAKSIGTVLAVQAVAQGILTPKFLLLCGLPMGYITKDFPEFGKILHGANIPTVIIQNSDDPIGSATEAKDYLETFGAGHTFITTKGETHDYEDYRLLREQLKTLIKSV